MKMIVLESITKDRHHVCNYCSKTFTRSEHCSRHQRAHTQEKPFACRYCLRRYGRRDLLVRHEKTLHAKETEQEQAKADDAPNRRSLAQQMTSTRTNIEKSGGDAANQTGKTQDPAPAQAFSQEGEGDVVMEIPTPNTVQSNALSASIGLESHQPSQSHAAEDTVLTSIDVRSDPGYHLDKENEAPSSSTGQETQIQNPAALQQANDPSSAATFSGDPNADIDMFMRMEPPSHLDFLDSFLCSPMEQVETTTLSADLDHVPQFKTLFELSRWPFSGFDTLLPQNEGPTGQRPHAALTGPFQQPQSVTSDDWNGLSQIRAALTPPSDIGGPPDLRLPLIVRSPSLKQALTIFTAESRLAFLSSLASQLPPEQMQGFCLPNAQFLNKCLQAYCDAFHVHFPVLHLPTIRSDSTPTSLILIICAIGALYRLERRMAMSLYKKADQALAVMVKQEREARDPILEGPNAAAEFLDRSPTRAVSMSQARLLLTMFATLNGNPTQVRRSIEGVANLPFDCHMRMTTLKSTAPKRESVSWQDWVERESSKRFFYGVLILSHILTTTYGLPPPFSIAMIKAIETPDDEALWEAETEGEWQALRLGNISIPTTSLGAAVSKLLYESDRDEEVSDRCKWSAFTTTVVIYAVSIHVWHIRADTDLEGFPGSPDPSCRSQRAARMTQLEAALGRCRQLLVQSREEGEPTWNDSEGPLMFNCQAILRVSYSRAVAGVGPFDRSVLFRETLAELNIAVAEYIAAPQPRDAAMTRAVARSVEAFFLPVLAGIELVRKTAALTWWIDHAVSGWDTALFATKWLHSIQILQRKGVQIDPSEQQVFAAVRDLLQEVNASHSGKSSLAAELARYWAVFYEDTWVWRVTPRIGRVLRTLADAYDESMAAV